jgi:hypothetical protein
VVAGDAAVLVHNCPTTGPISGAGLTDDELLAASREARDSFAATHNQLSQSKRSSIVTGQQDPLHQRRLDQDQQVPRPAAGVPVLRG